MNRRIRDYRHKTGLKELVYAHIEKYIREYFIISIIFIVGVIAGVVIVNNASEIQREEMVGQYTFLITSLQNNPEVNEGALLMDSIMKNVGLGILLWFMGSTVIGILGVYATILFRGFVLGYTIASAVAVFGTWLGALFIISSVLLQIIIFIPCIFAIAVSGMNLYRSIVKDTRKENIKLQVLKHTIFSAAMTGILVLSSLVEVQVSRRILMIFIEYF